ncbi:MAG: glycosyltransferase family 2 protein [Chitinophagaceae bacterium]|nr:glycosyltransferase family 2 protein [Chitinophagaceae bacterium]
MPEPLFSIIIPTYNRAGLIRKTIDSFLNQTFRNFEVIIVDDGSTDNTEKVIIAIPDSRVRYFKKDNNERAAARNFGTQKATGKYVAFFDSDDIAYPNHLEVAAQLIDKSLSEIFALNYEIRDENNKLINDSQDFRNINRQLIKGNLLSCSPVFVKREIAVQFPFDEDKSLTGSEDYLLWLQLAARYPICFSNMRTSAIIQHSGRSVVSFSKEALIKRKNLMLRKALNDPSISSYYKGDLNYLKENTYSYISLHLVMGKHKKESWYYFQKALGFNWKFFFSRRSKAIIKRLVF